MNIIEKSLLNRSLLVVIGAIFMSCASMGAGGGYNPGLRTYDHSYKVMKGYVEQAINESRLLARSRNESKDGKELQIILLKEDMLKKSGASTYNESGSVVITDLGDGRTEVRIENPEYHYTIPQHEREDYQDLLFNRIEKILEKEMKNQEQN
jgi:hypothetical protein